MEVVVFKLVRPTMLGEEERFIVTVIFRHEWYV